MNDNDILIARKTEGGCKTVRVDGDAADFERQNCRVKERQLAEEAYAKELEYQRICKEKQVAAEFAKRRKRVVMIGGLVLTVATLMAIILNDLMHPYLGMLVIAGTSATFGYHMK